MANSLYDLGRQKFLTGQIDWLTHDIKCVLVDTDDYTVDIATHEFLSDIPVGARVSTSANLSGKTATAGVADADDGTFSAVVGDQSEALVIYRDTGDPGTSQLIAYIDTAAGLPVTPAGGNIIIQWDNGANRIFRL